MPNEDFGLELAKEAISTVAKSTYDDVAHPTLHAIGSLIGLPWQAVDAALTPAKIWIAEKKYNYERTLKLLSEKMQTVDPEKITIPENYVAVPALQQLAYCYDSEELRDMYANLIAASMNTDTKWNVHPAYVDIIKQLTPDEAKLIKLFQSKELWPVVHAKMYMKDGKSYNDVAYNHSELGAYCECPQAVYSYLNNLNRLGIVDINYSTYCTYEGAYDNLDRQFQAQRDEWEKTGCKFKIEHGIIELTSFGRSFAKTCI